MPSNVWEVVSCVVVGEEYDDLPLEEHEGGDDMDLELDWLPCSGPDRVWIEEDGDCIEAFPEEEYCSTLKLSPYVALAGMSFGGGGRTLCPTATADACRN